MLAKYPIWGNNDITRNVFFFFFVCKYQNTEKFFGNFIWRNRATIPKTCILSVFHFVRYQNAKMHAKHPKETKFPGTCLLSVHECSWKAPYMRNQNNIIKKKKSLKCFEGSYVPKR